MRKTGTTIRYEYNHDGLRTQKFVDTNNKTDATYYTYNGKNIIHVIKNSDHLHIFYDAQNRPAKVSHNGIFYTYLYNLQGDVVGLLDKDGALVVEYKYDAWGKPVSITGTLADTLGKLNPFRYRAYVYDEETGLYYLWNRYYNPERQRFINGDIIVGSFSRMQHNVYSYCNNNPVKHVDPSGCVFIMTYGLEESVNELRNLNEDGSLDFEVIDPILGCDVLGFYHSFDGWGYRIDDAGTDYEHIHLFDNRAHKEYNQYSKGGNPRHGNNPSNKKGPSKTLKQKLKEKTGWDWDKNAREASGQAEKESKGDSTNKIDGLGLLGCLFVIVISYCTGTPVYAY